MIIKADCLALGTRHLWDDKVVESCKSHVSVHLDFYEGINPPLLHRSFPDNWYKGRFGKVWPPKQGSNPCRCTTFKALFEITNLFINIGYADERRVTWLMDEPV